MLQKRNRPDGHEKNDKNGQPEPWIRRLLGRWPGPAAYPGKFKKRKGVLNGNKEKGSSSQTGSTSKESRSRKKERRRVTAQQSAAPGELDPSAEYSNTPAGAL